MGDGQSPGRLDVGVVDARGRAVRAPGLASWLASVAPRRARGTVTIAVVSDARMRALNGRYRGKDHATDVLSFPATAGSGLQAPSQPAGARHGAPPARTHAPRTHATRTTHPAPPDVHLGDIVIALGVAERQAREQRHAVSVELRVLALHGLLHLLGYDHETDRGTMRRVEARLRRRGGLPGSLIERGARR